MTDATSRPPLDGLPRDRLPIDPRIRARRIAVKRAEGRRRLKVLGTLLIATSLVLVTLVVARSPLLEVRHVYVQGAAHTPVIQVVKAAGLEGRRPMLDVHSGSLERRLIAALPWVAEASVRRQWPATVRITVRERAPVAVVPGPSGRPALVDATGRVLDTGLPASAASASGLPTITGLAPAGAPGTWVGPGPAAQAALVVAGAVPPSLHPRLAQLTVTASGEIDGALTAGAVVYLGAPRDLPAKFVALATLLDRADTKGVTIIDVRVPEAPVLTHG